MVESCLHAPLYICSAKSYQSYPTNTCLQVVGWLVNFIPHASLTRWFYANYLDPEQGFPCTCRIFKAHQFFYIGKLHVIKQVLQFCLLWVILSDGVRVIKLPPSTGPSICGEARWGGVAHQHQPQLHQPDLQVLPWRQAGTAGSPLSSTCIIWVAWVTTLMSILCL